MEPATLPTSSIGGLPASTLVQIEFGPTPRENPRYSLKSQDHSKQQEPRLRAPLFPLDRQYSQYPLPSETWLSQEFWGRDAQPGLEPLLQAG